MAVTEAGTQVFLQEALVWAAQLMTAAGQLSECAKAVLSLGSS